MTRKPRSKDRGFFCSSRGRRNVDACRGVCASDLRRAAVLFLLIAAACGRERPFFASAKAPYAPVILISIDTLRSDHLPAYGYRGVETPNIDAFRRDGILFRNAYSHCPMTLPSHVSILTGLLPTQHGVRDNQGFHFDAAKHPTVASLLRAHGYATGAAVSSTSTVVAITRGDQLVGSLNLVGSAVPDKKPVTPPPPVVVSHAPPPEVQVGKPHTSPPRGPAGFAGNSKSAQRSIAGIQAVTHPAGPMARATLRSPHGKGGRNG